MSYNKNAIELLSHNDHKINWYIYLVTQMRYILENNMDKIDLEQLSSNLNAIKNTSQNELESFVL